MVIDFKNQTVLITGATRGIGKQMAADFAKLGADLILTGTQPKPTRLPKSRGGFTRYYAVDFTNAQSFGVFLRELASFKKIDVCINNAGISNEESRRSVEKASVEDWEKTIAVNLTAPFRITRAVAKSMQKQRYGRIVNISSILGVIGKAKRSAYSASKFGIRGLTVSSSLDLAPYGVLVNAVAPGFVMTDLTKGILGRAGMEEMRKQVPMGRLATPKDIANAVLFLASDQNTYITGQTIIADGGFVNV